MISWVSVFRRRLPLLTRRRVSLRAATTRLATARMTSAPSKMYFWNPSIGRWKTPEGRALLSTARTRRPGKCGCGGAHVLVALPFIDVGMDDLVSRLLLAEEISSGSASSVLAISPENGSISCAMTASCSSFSFLFHRVSGFF